LNEQISTIQDHLGCCNKNIDDLNEQLAALKEQKDADKATYSLNLELLEQQNKDQSAEIIKLNDHVIYSDSIISHHINELSNQLCLDIYIPESDEFNIRHQLIATKPDNVELANHLAQMRE